jgi:hypothetical protein
MKKNILLALLLVVVLTSCSKKQPANEPVPETVNTFDLPADALEPAFESVDYGFRVKGPDGWVKKADNLGMLVTYLKPGNPDMFQENISIARELKGDLTLDQYVTGTLQQVQEFFPESTINGQKETTVAGQAAVTLRYVMTVEGLVLETEQVIIDRPTEFMVLTFMAAPSQFSDAYPEFKKLLETLQLVGPEIPS